MKKAWFLTTMEYSPNGKGIMTSMEKTWFYQRLSFEIVIVMVKDKKYSIKDTMSIKVSFMYYMK